MSHNDRTEAQRIRERLLDIESEMEQEGEAHNEWPTVRYQRLDNETRALRRQPAEIESPRRRLKRAA